jgi:hypothetical protein
MPTRYHASRSAIRMLALVLFRFHLNVRTPWGQS